MKVSELSVRNWLSTILMLVVVLLFTACQTRKPQPYQCSLPSGYNLADAVSRANADLTHLECQYQFDEYVDRLLDIAATDPKQENKRQFSNFLAQVRDNGVISQLQAKETFQRYFTANFVSLGAFHNNCSTTCKQQADAVKKMKMELRDKQLGLLKVVGDKGGYAQADREFNQLLTLIDATCLACLSDK